MTGTRFAYWVTLLGFLGAGVFGGVVIATGNVVLIGLAVGAIVGFLMLSAIEAVVWVILFGTLILSGPLFLFFDQLNKLGWLFSVLGFFLSAAAILYAGTNKHDQRDSAPSFVPVAALFVAYSLFTATFSGGEFGEISSGAKRQFQFWGLIFALAICPIGPKTVRNWLLFLFIVSLLQLPFAAYQRIVLVPMRYLMPNYVVPVDVVAGTFEANLWAGGNSAGMAYFLVLIFAAMLSCYRENLIGMGKLVLFSLLIGAPLALGETKFVVVMLPAAMIVIYGDLIRERPVVFLMGAAITLSIAVALGFVYMGGMENDARGKGLEFRMIEMWDSNFGDSGYYGAGTLNRTTVLSYWWQKHGIGDPIGTIFGHGIGSSYRNIGEAAGHMDRAYPGLAIGLTGVSTLLWEVGLFGLVLYALVLVMAWFCVVSLLREATKGIDRVMLRALQTSLVLQGLFLFHSDTVMTYPSTQVLYCLTLGLVAWRWRYRRAADAGRQPHDFGAGSTHSR